MKNEEGDFGLQQDATGAQAQMVVTKLHKDIKHHWSVQAYI